MSGYGQSQCWVVGSGRSNWGGSVGGGEGEWGGGGRNNWGGRGEGGARCCRFFHSIDFTRTLYSHSHLQFSFYSAHTRPNDVEAHLLSVVQADDVEANVHSVIPADNDTNFSAND